MDYILLGMSYSFVTAHRGGIYQFFIHLKKSCIGKQRSPIFASLVFVVCTPFQIKYLGDKDCKSLTNSMNKLSYSEVSNTRGGSNDRKSGILLLIQKSSRLY